MTDAERALLRQEAAKFYKLDELDNDAICGEIDSRNMDTVYAWMAAFAESRLAAARAGERWIPVTERLPEENIPVEVHGMKRLDRAIAQRRGDEWLIETCSDLINIYPPKHWRPLLPSPPAESETKCFGK